MRLGLGPGGEGSGREGGLQSIPLAVALENGEGPGCPVPTAQMHRPSLMNSGSREPLCPEQAVCGDPVAGCEGHLGRRCLPSPGPRPCPCLEIYRRGRRVPGESVDPDVGAGASGPGLFPLSYLRLLRINTIDGSM